MTKVNDSNTRVSVPKDTITRKLEVNSDCDCNKSDFQYLIALEVKRMESGRIRISCPRYEWVMTIPYNYNYNTIAQVAKAYLEEHNIEIIAQAELKDGYVLLTSEFNTF